MKTKPRCSTRAAAAAGRSRAVILAAAVTALPRLQAQIIVNGSFESPDVPPGSVQLAVTPTGWSSVGPMNKHLYDHPLPTAGNWPDAQDGDQYAALLGGTLTGSFPFFTVDMTPATGLRQSFPIAAPGTYTLSWYDNAAVGVAGTPYDVTITDGSGSLIQLLSTPPLGSSAWSARSLPFSVGPGGLFPNLGAFSVTFRPTNVGVTLLDNVTFTVAAVPEPGAWAALGGLGCLGWAMGRRLAAKPSTHRNSPHAAYEN